MFLDNRQVEDLVRSDINDLSAHIGVLAQIRSYELALEVQGLVAGCLAVLAIVVTAILSSIDSPRTQDLAPPLLLVTVIAIVGTGLSFRRVLHLRVETIQLSSICSSLRRL